MSIYSAPSSLVPLYTHTNTHTHTHTLDAYVLILERSLLVLEPRLSSSENSKSSFMPLGKARSLRTESSSEHSSPSTALPGEGRGPARCQGASFSHNPQGPFTCLGLCCLGHCSPGQSSSFHSCALSAFSDSSATAEGRYLNATGSSYLSLLVDKTQQAPHPHALNMAKCHHSP